MNDIIGIPQYPWSEGDRLYASALNAAIANGPYLNNAGIANVLDFGADPTGTTDSTTAFQEALASGLNVWAPRGTYLITKQLALTTTSRPQSLQGDGLNTVLLIDARFDPSVTTGVILCTSSTRNDCRPTISDLMIRFVQPTDLVKTTTIASAAGTNTVTVNSATGIVVGMQVLDVTHSSAIPNTAYFTAAVATTVSSIAGNQITLSGNIASPGVSNGDTLQFAAARPMFKTLAAGGTAGTGGTGIQYPWAIYSASETLLIERVMVISSWNGVYIRGSSFQINKLDMFAYNVGLDIDQSYNFPAIVDYRFYPWGNTGATPSSDCLIGVYNDGATVAATLGRVDGVGVHNFQTWMGALNITASWTYGQFTNLMMDGSNSNLNVTASSGFMQVANCYSTKGNNSLGIPIMVNAGAGFRLNISEFFMTDTAPTTLPGIRVLAGVVTIENGYMWHGKQVPYPLIEVEGGTLYLDNLQLDASAARTDFYIVVQNPTSLYMRDCVLTTAAGSGAVGLSCAANSIATLENVVWNGWAVVGVSGQNNGAVFIAPFDATSMQSGAVNFCAFHATSHYNTAYGQFALQYNGDAAMNNTAFGSLAGFQSTGTDNTFIGSAAGYGGGGNNNTCVGAGTGYNLTTGGGNTIIGYNAGEPLTTGGGNIYLSSGDGSLTTSVPAGESNTLRVGYYGPVNLIRATAINTPTPKLFFDWLPASASYANDGAAASGGVQIGQLYRSGSAVMVRVA